MPARWVVQPNCRSRPKAAAARVGPRVFILGETYSNFGEVTNRRNPAGGRG
jgi:hypothetical protein